MKAEINRIQKDLPWLNYYAQKGREAMQLKEAPEEERMRKKGDREKRKYHREIFFKKAMNAKKKRK